MCVREREKKKCLKVAQPNEVSNRREKNLHKAIHDQSGSEKKRRNN